MRESDLAFFLGDTVEVSANDSIHHGKRGIIIIIDTPTNIAHRALFTVEFDDGTHAIFQNRT